MEENKKKTAQKVNGHINRCKLLNIRKEPSLQSEILGVLHLGDIFAVHKKYSNADFYKISTSTVKVGYCLKKFVELDEDIEEKTKEEGE